jgi:short-subunit dehydrogenase
MTETKVVMITGAAMGIGAATARLAAEAGYRVVLPDIDLERAKATAAAVGQGAWALRLDICSETEWAAALDAVWAREGRLDCLINNAAIVHTGWVRDVSLAKHRATLETNFFGAVIGMTLALPRFKAQGSGHLITVSSMNAFIPYPGIAIYAAAKHALRAFHAAFAIEERGGPVDFTLIYPTATETPMLAKEAEDDAMALAFSGTPVSPEMVAAKIVAAMASRPVEVFIPPERGEAVKQLGINPEAMIDYVVKNEALGLQKLQQRRDARTKSSAFPAR